MYMERVKRYRIIPKTIINLNKNIPIELHGGEIQPDHLFTLAMYRKQHLKLC